MVGKLVKVGLVRCRVGNGGGGVVGGRGKLERRVRKLTVKVTGVGLGGNIRLKGSLNLEIINWYNTYNRSILMPTNTFLSSRSLQFIDAKKSCSIISLAPAGPPPIRLLASFIKSLPIRSFPVKYIHDGK